ncbi:type I-D CRISPR-associated protein Cas7/Csc2 [Thermoflavimicrobium daqui]|jgi:CRISPR-associated protein Csc2|uniref:Type I-D CRISPR-associated protein Cas7/Csc2 n=1 Tax=Thermoflavimicrobium daqui TaxID=2137476 RepID=A0A364K776_9BACL|nr:type I-D CRISPR-associated protein Cas7/Csc2 [Thermoflavimicrobium daqui]RAL26155.1 type I-D CRISPR-associated protein Cas7/Csc2 [Thermoflavimicrobium daqui]
MENWKDSYVRDILSTHLLTQIPLSPRRNYASIVVLREFESTAVLTTEGERLDVEVVRAGQKQTELISRVLLQKRKQVAMERRTGRAFNRKLGWADECDFMSKMCGSCPDCLIYGFAASSSEGSQKSRILTDSGFSIRPYDALQRSITLNAIQDRTQGGVAGSAFAEREHIRPQAYFPTIETAVDVTPSEFAYILRNILTTTRYGAENQRQGFVKNHLVALLFGETEVISNLALVQHLYDRLAEENSGSINEVPLDLQTLKTRMEELLSDIAEEAYLPVQLYTGESLQNILQGLRFLWRNEEAKHEWLQELKNDQQTYLEKRENKGKKEKKGKGKKKEES